MSRPKSGTKEGKRATKKWRETMLAKYGKKGFHEQRVEIGRKGGSVCCAKGFALSHEIAVEAGRKGGLKSSRKGIKNGEGKK